MLSFCCTGDIWLQNPSLAEGLVHCWIHLVLWGFAAAVLLEARVGCVGKLHPLQLRRSRCCSAQNSRWNLLSHCYFTEPIVFTDKATCLSVSCSRLITPLLQVKQQGSVKLPFLFSEFEILCKSILHTTLTLTRPQLLCQKVGHQAVFRHCCCPSTGSISCLMLITCSIKQLWLFLPLCAWDVANCLQQRSHLQKLWLLVTFLF